MALREKKQKTTKKRAPEKAEKRNQAVVEPSIEKNRIQINPKLFVSVQPKGGISFKDEKFIKTGSGYEACITIDDYPAGYDDFWLTYIINKPNIIAEIDISNEDMNKIRQNINKSIKEHNSRYIESKNATDSADSVQRVRELNDLYAEITDGEVVKKIVIYLFVSGSTLQEVDDTVAKTIIDLEGMGYKASVHLNESKYDWLSMYRPYTKQLEEKNHKEGQAMTSRALAGGDPFHFTSLSDKYGSFYGETETGGTVLLDWFARSSARMSYNGIAIGSMGAGKSTTLKKILEDRGMRGDYIRCFDVANEYENLVTTLGGKVISLDGTNGILNALEILKTSESEENCFATHLSKLSTVYRLISPNSDSFEVMAFEKLIRKFYEYWGLLSSDENVPVQVTGFAPEQYPTWSDFLEYVTVVIEKAKATKDYIQDEVAKTNIQRYDNVKLVISGLVENYGNIFDGYTTIEDMLHTQIVCFNIKELKNMKTEVFDAQIFLAQSLWWDNCVRIGSEQKRLYEAGQLAMEDITHFLGIIDEAHTMVNANKTVTLDQLIVFCREARKYFGGLIFASQSIRDFVPEGSAATNVDKIKTLFELTQYKFIMRQDSNSIDTLNNVFANQLTPSELTSIPRLNTGECILAIAGDRNVRFDVYLTQAERELFRGGV